MSSGYNQYDPRLIEKITSEAPRFQPGLMQAPRRDAQRLLQRELQDINTPIPGSIEGRIRQLQKMRGLPNPPPGQGPRQVAPDPQPEPEQPLRSVLRRDNMG